MTIKFNQKQKDALAKNLDNIGVLNTVAILLGMLVDYKATFVNGVLMTMFSLTVFGFAIYLRRGDTGKNE